MPNAPSIYQVPLTLEDTGIADVITDHLGLKTKKPKHKEWRATVERATAKHKHKAKIAFVAKYMDNTDTYMSVFEALKAAGWHNDCDVDIRLDGCLGL